MGKDISYLKTYSNLVKGEAKGFKEFGKHKLYESIWCQNSYSKTMITARVSCENKTRTVQSLQWID